MEKTFIEKNQQSIDGLDFNQLREQGISSIRDLAGKVWTDHNLHDPGITSLEILCYALNDLSYRSQFDTKDLLSNDVSFIGDAARSSFFQAHESLTSNPLTINDYRELLVRIKGIKNAWLQALKNSSVESPVYIDLLKEDLSSDKQNAEGTDNQELLVSGLYKVLIELETDPMMGSFNQSMLPFSANIDGIQQALNAELYLQEDSHSNQGYWASVEDIDRIKLQYSRKDSQTVLIKALEQNEDAPNIQLPNLVLTFDKAVPSSVNHHTFKRLLLSEQAQVLPNFIKKQAHIIGKLEETTLALMSHRNLCEDFLNVATVDSESIAICADFDIEASADLELVQAQIVFAIEEYLNPRVQFYRLSEMLDMGLSIEQIYDSPFVGNNKFELSPNQRHGFILKEELLNSELKTHVYASDLINLIMDIEGLINVRNLTMRKYSLRGTVLSESEKWCLAITPGHQPRLDEAKSKFLLFKQGIPFTVNNSEYNASVNVLRMQAEHSMSPTQAEYLPLPLGRPRDTLTHYSIQNDFPETYQIGLAGLKANASNQRIMQAQQFKGYLAIFEQVLADYLAQLHHLPDLFSLEENPKTTYFSQFLDTLPATSGSFADEFYIDKEWFEEDKKRQGLYESEERYLERRNRLLDHLLARFAEQFTDYVFMLVNHQENSRKSQQELVNDKLAFLQQQPTLSRQRYLAFNYSPSSAKEISQEQFVNKLWPSNNVSGALRRICLSAGIQNTRLDDLRCQNFANTLMDTRRTGDEFRIEIKDPENYLLFKTWNLYPSREKAMVDAKKVFTAISKPQPIKKYFIINKTDTQAIKWHIKVGSLILHQDKEFDSESSAKEDISRVIDRINQAKEEELTLAELFDTREYGRDFRVEIKDTKQFILFKSDELYDNRESAKQAALALFEKLHLRSAYQIKTLEGTNEAKLILTDGNIQLHHDKTFDNVARAQAQADIIYARYYEVLESEVCNQEGMFLFEHLLLRPLSENSELLSVCIDKNKALCKAEDPYSFRVSIVLPYWPKRFQNMEFRGFLEDHIRTELPAHVHAKICWIDDYQMRELETAYKNWVIAKALFARAPSQMDLQAMHSNQILEFKDALEKAQNKLIQTLARLKTVYPQSVLHDCEDDDGPPPVRLGQTNLSAR